MHQRSGVSLSAEAEQLENSPTDKGLPLGGTVRVEGLGRGALQGDVAFVDVLERMGARVERLDDATEVHGTGVLHGVEVDMADISDTAQTLVKSDYWPTTVGISSKTGCPHQVTAMWKE